MGLFILLPFLVPRQTPTSPLPPISPADLSPQPHVLHVKLAPRPLKPLPPVHLRPPSSPIHFPVEIIFHILELAYFDDNRVRDVPLLLASSLVCRLWSTPAQKLLFRNVTLTSQDSYVAFSHAVNRSSLRGRMLGDSVVHLKAVLDSNQPYGLSHDSFAHAVSLCPRLSELNLSLYGCGAPGQDIIGSPDISRMQRIAPSFDAATLSTLESGPSISVLHFNNWSDNDQTLFQLLEVWPSLKSLSLSGTPPVIPSSTSIPPPSCVLEKLCLNFQSSPSVQFLKWLLHNSANDLRVLDFVRDPSLEVLEHLLVDSRFPIQSLSLPTCSTPDRASMIQKCINLRELRTESPSTTPTLYSALSKSIHHVALGIDKNTAMQPIMDLIKSSRELSTLSIHIWTGGEHNPRLSAVKIACAMKGVDLRLTADILLFRTMLREADSASLSSVAIRN